jgi:hypothetical protein
MKPITAGARVQFLRDNIGAFEHERLGRLTDEVYGIGDSGTSAFPHPRQNLANEGWWYVEVESKREPGKKLYVGVPAGWVVVL